MSETPEKTGKYEIVQEVGRGSMGTVYSAADTTNLLAQVNAV